MSYNQSYSRTVTKTNHIYPEGILTINSEEILIFRKMAGSLNKHTSEISVTCQFFGKKINKNDGTTLILMRGHLDILTNLPVNKENSQFYTIVFHKNDVAQSIFKIHVRRAAAEDILKFTCICIYVCIYLFVCLCHVSWPH